MASLDQKFLKGYTLEERIGAGGFGAVYRARQTTIDREVAIKIILPNFANNPDFIRRFESEAHTIARLEHPHITPLIDYWRDPEGAYLVMRYLRGGSIREALQDGPYELFACSQALDQIASALDFAHRNKVIHRDIKPGNILLDEDGNVYLADFGIAKALDGSEGLTATDAVVGSLDYISPEQARNEPVTPRTDIYCLGVTLYEMLTAEHPFKEASSIERLYKHINDPLPDILTLPEDVCTQVNVVIQKATAKNPEHRYPEALALALAFREAIGQDGQQISNLVEQLTLREQEILIMIVQGQSNREIATKLVVTLGTVKWHIRQIYNKLGVRSRVQAIVRARELNLIVTGDTTSFTLVNRGDERQLISLPEPENPYKGLHAFREIDAHDFFGREELIQKLVDHLQKTSPYHRFLVVIGPSGSGKSSLVRAGLIPALWKDALPGSGKWFIVDMVPGAYPLDKLETVLIRVAANQASNLREQLQRDHRGLLRAADIILPNDDTELVIVVDQFEEVFTLVENKAERQHFLDLIRTAVSDPRSRVRVILTLRADYYDRPLHYPEFGELIRNRMETVLPLNAKGLERAIRGPAERVGVTFEQGLVEQIVSTMNYQTGALPLLQYALTELFDRREGRLITHEAYQQIGGAVGALANRADEIYLSLTLEGQELAHQMFMRLVTLGEGTDNSRRRVLQAEILSLTDNIDLMEEIIDQFAAYRLLSLDHDHQSRKPTIEVAHEAILREWERLREWINESRTEMRLQYQLSGLVADWRKAYQDASYLLRGARLEQFESWAETTRITLTPAEKNYLQASLQARHTEASEEQARREREVKLEKRGQRFLQIAVGVFAIATLVAISLALFAFDQEAQAEKASREAALERDSAQELAIVNGARAAFAGGDFNTALALAIAANQRNQASSLAQSTLSQIAYQPAPIRMIAPGQFHHIDISPDGRLIIGGGYEGALFVWNIETGEVVYALQGHSGTINDVGFSQDGRQAFSIAQDMSIILWDMTTGEMLRRLQNPQVLNGQSFFGALSPDGQMILTTNGGNPTQFPDQEANLLLWDVATGEILRVFNGHTMIVAELAISPDGRMALSGAWDEEIILWDMATGEEIRRKEASHGVQWRMATDIIFRPDGRTALIGLVATSAILIDLETMATLQRFGEAVAGTWWWQELALSPDGQTLYLQGNRNLYDVDSGRVIGTIAEQNITTGAAFLPTGAGFVLGSERGIWLYSHQYGAEILRLGLYPWWYQVSPDAETIIISLWNPSNPENDCSLHILDGQGQEIRRFTPEHDLIQAIGCAIGGAPYYAIMPDAQAVFSGTVENDGILWDIETGEILQRFAGHVNWITSVAISPDGQLAATAACDFNTACPVEEIILWDITSGAELRRLIPPITLETIHTVEFSPDATRLLSAHRGGLAIIWDVATGDILQQFAPASNLVRSAVFSPDARQIITTSAGFGSMSLWDVETGAERLTMHAQNAFSVAFSPDGRYAVLSGGDITIWDLRTGQIIRHYDDMDSFSLYPHFSPDGQSFFIMIDHQIHQYRVDWGNDLLSWAQSNRYIRDLSCTERETYRIPPYCER